MIDNLQHMPFTIVVCYIISDYKHILISFTLLLMYIRMSNNKLFPVLHMVKKVLLRKYILFH